MCSRNSIAGSNFQPHDDDLVEEAQRLAQLSNAKPVASEPIPSGDDDRGQVLSPKLERTESALHEEGDDGMVTGVNDSAESDEKEGGAKL